MPVMEKEKSALTAEENQILSMSEKIQQNLKQDESFANELDLFLGSDKKQIFYILAIHQMPLHCLERIKIYKSLLPQEQS